MHLADAAEVRVLQQVAANSKLSTPAVDRPSNRATSATAGRRYHYSDLILHFTRAGNDYKIFNS